MSVAPRPLHGLALCAGIGGLELGLRLALGDRYRLVGAVERDSHAASVLVARMADQALDQAPVWDDLASFDGRPWRGRVDLVTAGFPCQPFSAAGRRRGLDDHRWLWPEVARVVREMEPALVFVENVRGFLAGPAGLGTVLGDLADLGFDADWQVLSAAALGATHRRERFWLLAHRHDRGLPILRRQPHHYRHPRDDTDGPGRADVAHPRRPGLPAVPSSEPGDARPDAGRTPDDGHLADRDGQALAHPDRSGRDPGLGLDHPPASEPPWGGEGQRAEPHPAGRVVADATGQGPQRALHRAPQRGPGPARPGEGLPLWPPPNDDDTTWERVIAADGPQPSIRRMADGTTGRLDRLHSLGNGVVPLVAASAFLSLAQRAGLLDEAVTP